MDIFANFEQALAFWRRRHGLNNESIWDEFEASERMVLSHHPRCAREAVAILDVLIQQGDARCDGLDREALSNLSGFISGEPKAIAA